MLGGVLRSPSKFLLQTLFGQLFLTHRIKSLKTMTGNSALAIFVNKRILQEMTTDVKRALRHLVYPLTACTSDAIIFYSQVLFPKYLDFFRDKYFQLILQTPVLQHIFLLCFKQYKTFFPYLMLSMLFVKSFFLRRAPF